MLALGDRRNGHQPAQHDVGEALGPFGGGADLGDGKAALGLLPADVDLKENGLDDAELFGLPVDILKQLIGADGFDERDLADDLLCGRRIPVERALADFDVSKALFALVLDGGLKALARIESGRFVMEHVFPQAIGGVR